MANWKWHAKPMGSYSRGSTEGDDNACLITSKLMLEFGWTLEACCGMLGNIANEGGLNPWQYEISYTQELGRIPTKAEANSVNGKGMGLLGWTPCRKWTNPNAGYWPWDISTFDGYGPNFYDQPGNTKDAKAQTELIGRCMRGVGNGNMWIRSRRDIYGGIDYNMRADVYITLTDVEQAALVWLWQAEYPSSIIYPNDPTRTQNKRKASANAWYQHLIDIGFTPSRETKIPLIVLLKKAVDNIEGGSEL